MPGRRADVRGSGSAGADVSHVFNTRPFSARGTACPTSQQRLYALDCASAERWWVRFRPALTFVSVIGIKVESPFMLGGNDAPATTGP